MILKERIRASRMQKLLARILILQQGESFYEKKKLNTPITAILEESLRLHSC
jgi:hypothetical protein